jgi:hypothetical protein
MLEAVPAFIVRIDDDEHAARRPSQANSGDATPDALHGCATLTRCAGSAVSALTRSFRGGEPTSPGAPTLARRLRPDQYRRVIADVFGPTIKVEGRFEPDVRDDGLFAVGAGHVGVTSTGMEQYEAMARATAAQVVSEPHRATLIPCTPKSDTAPDDECALRFFAKAGPLLYRRPLDQDELDAALKLAGTSAQTSKSFYAGLEMSLAGILESPQFLFRREVAEPDPGNPGAYRLNAYSKASQLSFFLWNAGPDRKLIVAAQNGTLNTRSGLASEVERMLQSPRLETGVPLQQMPHRFPVHPGRLHGHMGHSLRAQELVQFQQRRGGRRKGLHFIVHRVRHTANTRNNAVLMNVKPRTARIQYFHTASRMIATLTRRQEKPLLSKSNIRAPERKRSWQQFWCS